MVLGAVPEMLPARALRELQAVTEATRKGQWCWAVQASDALRNMKLLAEASLAIDGPWTT